MDGHRGPTLIPDLDEDIRLPDIDELERQFGGTSSNGPHDTAFADAILTIFRNAPDDVQDRVVTLWFDDEEWARIRYGQSLTRSVPAGHHRLKAHNTLFATTFEFDATPGERIHLRCSNTLARGSFLLLWIIHWAAIRVRIERA
jgi:hypothetical protein